eukprot:2674772-Prymnesium_polylepis.1
MGLSPHVRGRRPPWRQGRESRRAPRSRAAPRRAPAANGRGRMPRRSQHRLKRDGERFSWRRPVPRERKASWGAGASRGAGGVTWSGRLTWGWSVTWVWSVMW